MQTLGQTCLSIVWFVFVWESLLMGKSPPSVWCYSLKKNNHAALSHFLFLPHHRYIWLLAHVAKEYWLKTPIGTTHSPRKHVLFPVWSVRVYVLKELLQHLFWFWFSLFFINKLLLRPCLSGCETYTLLAFPGLHWETQFQSHFLLLICIIWQLTIIWYNVSFGICWPILSKQRF